MKWTVPVGGLCLALLVANGVAAQPVQRAGGPRRGTPVVIPDCCPPPISGLNQGLPGGSPTNPSGTPNAGQPDATQPNANANANANSDAFAQAPEGGTQAAASYDPGLFGDLNNNARRIVTPPVVTPPVVTPPVVTPPPDNTNNPPTNVSAARGSRPGEAQLVAGDRIVLAAAVPWRTSFKIGENESPLPTDRVFLTYNYYNDVDVQQLGLSRSDLHREMIGFEKTFLDGNASFGVRLPFLQLTGSKDLEDTHIDDLTMIFKYAFLLDRATGNVLSGGLVLTAPTGERIRINGETAINSTVFQPFVGFIYNLNRDVFFQGFSSVAAPTDARDVTVFFNSVGTGYHLYRNPDPNALLRELVPVAELHVNTPLNHRGSATQPIGYADSVDFTGGCHFIFRRATAGIAFGTPLTGPKPYEFEVLANVNFRF